MNTKEFRRNTPPVIRVFLSSTFADMEHERSYFNEVVVPKLSRACAERGVSFFSVDLRWGITEEEQVNGQVLPICLGEIDKCRPYFVGILGNRYGSVLEEVPKGLASSIPWLEGKEGHSITELEMLYAVLDREKTDAARDCAFYFRSEQLSNEWYGQTGEENRLMMLKERIRDDVTIPQAQYNSLEEFGENITRDILGWLDREFPATENIHKVRRQWYDNELLRGYIENEDMNSFLNSYVSQSQRPLLLYGDGARGKTTFLTAWEPTDGEKVLINCASDDIYLYWPSIAKELVNKINAIDDSCGCPDMKKCSSSVMMELMSRVKNRDNLNAQDESYFVTDEEREAFRLSFLEWMNSLNLKKRIYIVLNDLNLLEDETSRILSWLPFSACENIRLICSTNDDAMVQNAQILGWNCKEMPEFKKQSAQQFVNSYLHSYGKNLSQSQLENLLDSIVVSYPGQLRFVTDFLINYGRFHNLDTIIGEISASKTIGEVYQYIYNFLIEDLSQNEKEIVRVVFGLLRYAQISLKEQACYQLSAVQGQSTAMEWAKVIHVFEQFNLVKGDYWNLRDEELQKFVDSLLTEKEIERIQEILGDFMLQQLKADKQELGQLRIIRENTTYSKACLYHYQEARNWDKLCQALHEREILFYLVKVDWYTVRVAWMKIFLYSDIDIPKNLYALIEKYNGEDREDKIIAIYVASLFEDLEFLGHVENVKKLVGTTRCPGSLRRLSAELVSRKFKDIYNTMVGLKRTGQIRRLYELIEEIMVSDNSFSLMEKCLLLALKADCTEQLRLTNESLQITGEYYETAIKSGFTDEMQRALALRGDALYRCGAYDEAQVVQSRCIHFAMMVGDLRRYLASENILGMCMNRNKRCEEAIEKYDMLIDYWNKLGNVKEAGNVLTNKATAYYMSGDARKALDIATDFYQQIENDESLIGVAVSILGNMGSFAFSLKEYDKAEEYLLHTIAKATAIGKESTLLNARLTLIQVYEKTQRFIKATEQYEAQMELFWQRREYVQVCDMLKAAVKLLLPNHYTLRAQQLQATWEERFEQVEGGKAFYEEQVSEKIVDAVEIEQLKEQLVVAKSENDVQKMAKTCMALASWASLNNKTQGVEYYLQAAELYHKMDDEQSSQECMEQALVEMFDKGKIVDKDAYSKLSSSSLFSPLKDVADIWEQMGIDNQQFDDLLKELLTHLEQRETLICNCLIDLVRQMIRECNAEEIKCLADSFKGENGRKLKNAITLEMVSNIEKDLASLMKDYLSPFAENILDKYEKYVVVLAEWDKTNAAAIAGNVALIFRRRREEEKTLYYHDMSKKLYEELNQKRDALIELSNMATACKEFGQLQQAVTILRKGVKEAQEANELQIMAAIAGNLAKFLMESGDTDAHEEIIRCFSIEENFFRNSDSERDLVISLLNQVVYLKEQADISAMKSKLDEAGKLICANGFKEFETVYVRLASLIMDMSDTKEQGPSNNVIADIKELLAASGEYVIVHSEKEGEQYHVVCQLKETEKTANEQLHIIFNPLQKHQVLMAFLYQPKLFSEKTTADIEEYVNWWNERGYYRLSYEKEDYLLKAECLVRATNWQEIVQRSKFYFKLWSADKINMLAMSLGVVELKVCQGKKLEVLNEV